MRTDFKIVLEEHQKIFVTSDTHGYHKNICRGESSWSDLTKTRDFSSIEIMTDVIINNINNKVGQDDILIHVGDWTFGGFDNIKKFRDRIFCKTIYLILGNHDTHIKRNREGCRINFTEVWDYLYTTIQTKEEIYNIVFSHFPICSWQDMNKGAYHLFGHVHLPPHKKIMCGKAMDVGVDGNGMKPYELHEAINLIRNNPTKSIVLPQDHHEEEVR